MAEKKIVELKQTAERIVQILDDVDQTYAETRSNAQDAKTTVTSLQQTMTDLTEQVGEQGSVLEGHKSDIATLKEIAAEYSLTYVDDLLSLIKEKDGVSEVVGSPIKIVSAVETVSSVITVTRITPASNTVTLEEPGVIEYRVESLQDGVETGDITVTWKVNNVTVLTETVKQGVNTFKLDGRVAAGNNGVTATFKDSIGTTYTSRWSVDVIDMYITSTFNDTVTYIGNANVSFTAFGALKKTIYFLLDGEEIYQTDITASGVQSSYIVPHQPHGAHSLEIYCKATMNNGREIESTHLYYDIMFIDDGNNTPIIRWPYDNAPLTQFTATTFKYSVYTPNSLTTDIELYVGDDKVSSLNVDRNQKEWVYKPQAVGENITFMIKAGDVEKVKVLDAVDDFSEYICPVNKTAFTFGIPQPKITSFKGPNKTANVELVTVDNEVGTSSGGSVEEITLNLAVNQFIQLKVDVQGARINNLPQGFNFANDTITGASKSAGTFKFNIVTENTSVPVIFNVSNVIRIT